MVALAGVLALVATSPDDDDVFLGAVKAEARVPTGATRRLEVKGQIPTDAEAVQCDVDHVTRVAAEPDR